MIVDLPATTTGAVSKKLVELRESGGAVTLGRVLTLVVVIRDPAKFEAAIEAANEASREHPCRVIVLARGDRDDDDVLDAQIRVGGDAGASEVVFLRLRGELSEHEQSVVLPFLLPDTPVVAWWPSGAPAVPKEDPVGRLAIRRITDATNSPDPRATISSRLESYAEGDSDLAWSRITYWRALLTTALDQQAEPVRSVTVSGLREEPALDILAGWFAARLDVPVVRKVGDLRVEMVLADSTVSISRPQTGTTATLIRTGQPDTLVSLARRETRDCLAEELRRLDRDEIYEEALAGLTKVTYE
ncbi:glucose-6-phosphate dehydrogenase assembly protein OpcA [Rhodococcus sp. BP-349]|uniref:glucose-6-phosphate dehydrogenase assembly protein OpcA n=1 Tax=unclassified Rhodococcus (in: high G+C Gram-positive bacteria) TaxID=192944 RepID=UPI001C9A91EB|nr:MULTISPECIES: glucose-6-phosphate dehydrogenase assembly protein OpcA [unclassified Rhodococcus (in: high G+C Gram-positive bacteria)]MBY6541176.1 glucose-6-phosphate dehydrogenase assembly protein OpcA [Rhodococcus sp. BP-363]MBY6544798.1 glucose-6-phosphate dehydrogenase assembly protein OpcA [Rhodococcus sp. BP-369]MBY6564028.1 glucose-6-phosphate dehydrogenase assembly protein OpcA [Rhodococcus sp. BP-370]MBY6579035.1 glucose-6-phosphate dehydrogenase assembly protein OpcA [Rhodococcus s